MVLFAQVLRHLCCQRFYTKIGRKFDQKSFKNRSENGVRRGIKGDEGFGCHKKGFDGTPAPRKSGLGVPWGGLGGDMEMDKSRGLTRHWCHEYWRVYFGWLRHKRREGKQGFAKYL